jgi:hypothetical protein
MNSVDFSPLSFNCHVAVSSPPGHSIECSLWQEARWHFLLMLPQTTTSASTPFAPCNPAPTQLVVPQIVLLGIASPTHQYITLWHVYLYLLPLACCALAPYCILCTPCMCAAHAMDWLVACIHLRLPELRWWWVGVHNSAIGFQQ